MKENDIGGETVSGGSLLWNGKARKISEEGYLNYINRIKSEEIEDKEYRRIIRENNTINKSINQTFVTSDNAIIGNISGGTVTQDKKVIEINQQKKI